jgi:hypothetical protein
LTINKSTLIALQFIVCKPIRKSILNKINKVFELLQNRFFSDKTKEKAEYIIVFIAIISFLLHLSIIGLVKVNVFHFENTNYLLNNPIAAIYTPFSFILIYEVYLLVYYLPKSTTIYIGKQYEIITLIIIRRVFKDLSKLELSTDWFSKNNDLQFSFDLLLTIILFFLIFIFYKLNHKKGELIVSKLESEQKIAKFIKIKNIVSVLLIPIFLVLSIYSFGIWIYESFFSISQLVISIKDVNKIFFDDFFTILILIDVLLLLFSLLHTDDFYKVIKNSGFIISTILIKISFGVDGVVSNLLIFTAVSYGVIILGISNKYKFFKTNI